MKSILPTIPQELIYEMIDGTPIYYRGYQKYLEGTVQIDELMGSSYLQSLIITNLVVLLSTELPKTYRILSSEIGLQMRKKSWRAADIAIFTKQQLKETEKGNKYIGIPPKIVIEIDTKANLEQVQLPLGYFYEKTDELLNFGVEKVIWIFTESKKVMLASPTNPWEVYDWDQPIQIMEEVFVNVADLVEED